MISAVLSQAHLVSLSLSLSLSGLLIGAAAPPYEAIYFGKLQPRIITTT